MTSRPPKRGPEPSSERARRRLRRPRHPERGGGRGRAVAAIGPGILGVAAIVLVGLFSFGLDLWTDALWYRSVGFDSVFWTRVGAQAGLFLGRGSLPCSSSSSTSGSPAG